MLKSQLNTRVRFLRPALLVGAVLLAATGPTNAHATGRVNTSSPAAATFRAGAWDTSHLGSLDPKVFTLALNAAGCAVRSGKAELPTTLTVIDYSKPSTKKRLWVIDLRTRELLFEELVAHGQGSGSNMATQFSNDAETHQSSIGLYRAKDTYLGKNGYSLRLEGLEAGFNDRAMERAIVVHGAAYVSETVARAQGRLGRSWGCPAVRESVVRELIDRMKGSGLVFAYYPDPNWLSTSQFFGNCGAAAGTTGVTPVVEIG